MKFGVIYNTGHRGVDPDGMIAVARHAEDRGFESFYMPEHEQRDQLSAFADRLALR